MMAIPARRSSDQVVGGLAKSDRAIVTIRTSRHRLRVIDESHLLPRRCEVAAFAEIRRLRVRLRFADSRGTVVTGEALCRRPFEAPVDVA
jgi:hypothetical protein